MKEIAMAGPRKTKTKMSSQHRRSRKAGPTDPPTKHPRSNPKAFTKTGVKKGEWLLLTATSNAAKGTPKKSIKYYKGDKEIGTSKYKQGEGKLAAKERFKRDK